MNKTNLNFDDETLRRSLEKADIPSLLIVAYQLTGDASLLEGDELPSAYPTDGLANMPPATQSRIRDRAGAALRLYRDEGRALPPAPSEDELMHMMEVAVGEKIADAYAPMMMERMHFEDVEQQLKTSIAPKSRSFARDLKVIVVGAGLAGVGVGMKFEEMGVDYTILERHGSFGGVWFENIYPGAAVDTPNQVYSYAHEPSTEWSKHFSGQKEVRAYIERCALKHGVDKRTRFGVEVISGTYNPASSTWSVLVKNAKRQEETLVCDVFISATGHLNQPKMPDIKGLETYAGPSFHSARWDKSVELKDKNVIMIGSGASANQIARHVAKDAKTLTIFQRSAPWIGMLKNYAADLEAEEKWLLENVPFYATWYRFRQFWNSCDALFKQVFVDPEWQGDRSVNATNDRMRTLLERRIRRELAARPDLIEKAIPKYPPFGARLIADNDWYKTLMLPHVALITDPIDRIETDAVVTAGGERYQADVLILATGFHHHRYMWPIELYGKSGRPLQESWADDPRSYLSGAVPDYPNMFCIYGPNMALAHGGSALFMAECQIDYISRVIEHMRETGIKSIECKQSVFEDYHKVVDERLSRTVWAQPGFRSTYKNSVGRVVSNSPWSLAEYWQKTRDPNWDDYAIEHVADARKSA